MMNFGRGIRAHRPFQADPVLVEWRKLEISLTASAKWERKPNLI